MVMSHVVFCHSIGETGISWHVFQKNSHKTQESKISGMSDVPVKRYTSVLPIQGIKFFRPLTIISKICCKHDHVRQTCQLYNPDHGVS